jgi:sigma-54 specific flagellar transcriptional regulator A
MSQVKGQLIGDSAAMRELKAMLAACAPSNASVMICGETGVGKEVVCRQLHALSDRADQPLVPLNCAAIPGALLESELFGHRKGAFTGALSDRIGRIEMANGGTLFLDEIGDMPLDLQVKLLRVLEERCIEPLGGGDSRPVDIRVIAATHQNLQAMVERGEFREDLYYRLNVIPLTIPPLRERGEDIGTLCRHFTELHAVNGKSISFTARSYKVLEHYAWPGNVREMSNLIMRFSVLFAGNRIDLAQVPHSAMPPELARLTTDMLAHLDPGSDADELNLLKWLEKEPAPVAAEQDSAADWTPKRAEELVALAQGMRELPSQGIETKQILQELESNFIKVALTQSNGNVSKAAGLLNLQRTTLIQKIEKYNLN